ncbi:probable plastid-lipid-associated protein 8, chloroplastic [Punica granatum]|uniref:Uncharacterized protein n=2 Tax=Punica granatum TaxID=22663 RepID=A0A2I0HMQ3_PUNGR|nr:probable plastid-lipid-associated protein 8, chloroplastic [Punica granatum]PKI32941.1 hypothetical protein CRG98_046668 [Punica granatum]
MASVASTAVFSPAVSSPKWRSSKPQRSLANFRAKPVNLPCRRPSLRVCASVSAPSTELRTGPDDLVASILSKVLETDGGVSLKPKEHQEVAEVASELQKYCISEPVKSPLIFGDWDVVYCSRPTSPGGGYRSAVGRLFFQTKEMVQALEAPDIVRNKVSFSLLGFLDGEVSLKGKLKALDYEWIQVIFEAPQLQLGGLEFSYGGQSEVKLQIMYIDEKIRLGKGNRGSLFVFRRR